MNKDKIETAAALFGEGFNCAQAVVAAYGTQYGFTREQCLKMSASFGGGIGRMRETCGAACGLFLLAGLETGAIEGRDTASKMNNYATVKKLADRFIEENGALRCEDILSSASRSVPSCESTLHSPHSITDQIHPIHILSDYQPPSVRLAGVLVSLCLLMPVP